MRRGITVILTFAAVGSHVGIASAALLIDAHVLKAASGPRVVFTVVCGTADDCGHAPAVRSFGVKRPASLVLRPPVPGAVLGHLHFQVGTNKPSNGREVALRARAGSTIVGHAHGATVVLRTDRRWFLRVSLPVNVINPVLRLRGAGVRMLQLPCAATRFGTEVRVPGRARSTHHTVLRRAELKRARVC
jgi:hypothetical protein